jgi:hypothetical protein
MPGWVTSEQLVQVLSRWNATFVDDVGSGSATLATGGWVMPWNVSHGIASAVPIIVCWTAVPPITG